MNKAEVIKRLYEFAWLKGALLQSVAGRVMQWSYFHFVPEHPTSPYRHTIGTVTALVYKPVYYRLFRLSSKVQGVGVCVAKWGYEHYYGDSPEPAESDAPLTNLEPVDPLLALFDIHEHGDR